MTIKSLREHFHISERKHEGRFLFHEKEVSRRSRMCYKYLCPVTKKGIKWTVEGFEPTSKLEVLKANIENYVSKLPYDSEYYYPLYRKSIFVEFIIYDYLNEIGFEWINNSFGYETYIHKHKNVYNSPSDTVSISINGVSTFEDDNLPKEVSIGLHLSDSSWVNVTVPREVEAIKKGIDSLLKPYFVGESVNNLEVSDKLKNHSDIDIIFHALTSECQHFEGSYKAELKKKLLEMAEKL